MKNLGLLCIAILLIMVSKAQSLEESTLISSYSETYIEIKLERKSDIQVFGKEFSIDKVTFDPKRNEYVVKLWLPQKQYADFLKKNIPYSVCQPERANLTMGTTASEMLQWHRYPTYEAYLSLMDSFQTHYHQLCHIDTLLRKTKGNHSILIAHITKNVQDAHHRPQVFYSSTIHGDELTGYYCMLRLIDYLLQNYGHNQQVTNILDHLDVWICPCENPDGVYRGSDTQLNTLHSSTRGNANGVDLNRSYPGPEMEANMSLEAEVEAMIHFFETHHFVLSANFHSGSEVVNYPWDTWDSQENLHADNVWWEYVAHNYADTVYAYADDGYFTEFENGITLGGDWYSVHGSRQDYVTFRQHCREMTIELSASKMPAGNIVDKYWQYNRQSLLNHLQEAQYGFYGTVTDQSNGLPVAATITICGHDSLNSEVITDENGNYFRPVKAGRYNVIYSAKGYCSDTIQITTSDKSGLQTDVALSRCETENSDTTTIVRFNSACQITIYPNPAADKIFFQNKSQDIHYQLFDIFGKLISEERNYSKNFLDISTYPSGVYLIKILLENQREKTFKLIKK